jgi:hypothetical protein
VRLLVLTAALTTALVLTAGASAESLQVKHKPWHTLTTHQKVVVLKRQIHKDKCVIRFWKNHRELASASTTLSYTARTQTHWARVSLRIASKHLRALEDALRTPRYLASSGVGSTGWDRVAQCESGGNWGLVTGNGFYWGLQWVPSTWDGRARALGLPTFNWFISHHTFPSRALQIRAATGMSLSNWPVCGARY